MCSEGSETIMETASRAYKALCTRDVDGIVHSIWQQMVNIKEPRDAGAIPAPATLRFSLRLNLSVYEFFILQNSSIHRQ